MAYYETIPYSITFINSLKESRNTFTNWRLIPTSRPVVALPGITTKFVSIPGKDDPYDLSNYLTGKIVKSSRSGSFEFIFLNNNIDAEIYDIYINDETKKQDVGTSYVSIESHNDQVVNLKETGSVVNINSSNTFVSKGDYMKLCDDIMKFLHGQRLEMILAENPKYYYEGRFSFDGFETGDAFSTVKISYQVNADPKKVIITK